MTDNTRMTEATPRIRHIIDQKRFNVLTIQQLRDIYSENIEIMKAYRRMGRISKPLKVETDAMTAAMNIASAVIWYLRAVKDTSVKDTGVIE